jgi:chloramphenicol-sensitive protein RarD
MYAEGVKRVALSRMGFLQYIAPTMQLLLGVLAFGETLEGVRAISFAMIISALLVFALTRRKAR